MEVVSATVAIAEGTIGRREFPSDSPYARSAVVKSVTFVSAFTCSGLR
ncbi:MAG: hypothetical protein LC775_07205 [Acidobacteria bacterium]|nr:hypothetical protein [Acidobacteriota bacterium]